MRLQLARDTLIDPTKRFAYDRFGPQVLQWRQAKTIRDYVFTGVQNIGVYYIGTGMALLLLSVFGQLQAGKFWRYLVMAAMFAKLDTSNTGYLRPESIAHLMDLQGFRLEHNVCKQSRARNLSTWS